MAVAYDASTDGGNNGGASTSLTWSHTLRGSNTLLVVNVAGDNLSGADDVSGVTYNGTAMTLVDSNVSGYPSGTVTSNTRIQYLYQLLGAASGANNVVVSASGTHYLIGAAISFNGVGAIDTSTKNWAASVGDLTATTAITTGLDNAWVVVGEAGYNIDNAAPTAGAGATFRVAAAAFGDVALFSNSTQPLTPAGSYNFTTDRSPGNALGVPIRHILLSFGPVVSGTGWGPLLGQQNNRLVVAS